MLRYIYIIFIRTYISTNKNDEIIDMTQHFYFGFAFKFYVRVRLCVTEAIDRNTYVTCRKKNQFHVYINLRDTDMCYSFQIISLVKRTLYSCYCYHNIVADIFFKYISLSFIVLL